MSQLTQLCHSQKVFNKHTISSSVVSLSSNAHHPTDTSTNTANCANCFFIVLHRSICNRIIFDKLNTLMDQLHQINTPLSPRKTRSLSGSHSLLFSFLLSSQRYIINTTTLSHPAPPQPFHPSIHLLTYLLPRF